MSANLLYNVVSEFKFELGSAVAETSALAGAVEAVDSAAKGALGTLAQLGPQIGLAFGLGGIGVLGLLTKALSLTMKFQDSTNRFAAIFSANVHALGDGFDGFNKRLALSRQFMGDLADSALSVGANDADFSNVAKSISASALTIGLKDPLDRIQQMTKNLFVGAPAMGLQGGDLQMQIMRVIEGVADRGSPLFAALLSDTKAFQPFRGQGGTQKFNMLPIAQRFELLDKALAQFGSKPEVIAQSMGSLSNQLSRAQALLLGMNGLLRPIGDAFERHITPALTSFNNFLQAHREKIKTALGSMTEKVIGLAPGVFDLVVGLSQLKSSVHTVVEAVKLITLGQALFHLGGLFMRTGSAAESLRVIWFGLLRQFLVLRNAFSLGLFAGLRTVGGMALAALVPLLTVLGLMAFFVVALTASWVGMSKAIRENIGGARDSFVALGGRFAAVFMKLKDAAYKFVFPFIEIWNGLVDILGSPTLILAAGNALASIADTLVTIFDTLGTVFVGLYAMVAGFINGAIELFAQIPQMPAMLLDLISGNAGMAQAMADDILGAFSFTFNDILDRALGKSGKDGNGKDRLVANGNTNIYGGVNVNMNFKENAEPDRVAFGLKEQINKAMRAKTQGRGQTLGFAGGN
jgi:hypothetical protein